MRQEGMHAGIQNKLKDKKGPSGPFKMKKIKISDISMFTRKLYHGSVLLSTEKTLSYKLTETEKNVIITLHYFSY